MTTQQAEVHQPSGAAWCEKFATSRSINDLADPFRGSAVRFLGALHDAGAQVTVSATRRPKERAYLMHWCCLIAGYHDRDGVFHQADPDAVPALAGVAIDWTCGGDVAAARAAAAAMVRGYAIAYPAALDSNHIRGTAIDMTVAWRGAITVRDARGIAHTVSTQEQLWEIGASYGVHKLPPDAPHWSGDGH